MSALKKWNEHTMNYDDEFWNKYADENESRYNEEFSKYVRNLTTSLPGVQSILEIGCGTGIDLRLFPDSVSYTHLTLPTTPYV